MFAKGASFALLLTAAPSIAASQAHQLVDVGGHRLDVLKAGAGTPVVVFETGLGDSLDTWAPVWPAVAAYTTVVAYSRAGFGRSELGASVFTARHAVTELHQLLTRLGRRNR